MAGYNEDRFHEIFCRRLYGKIKDYSDTKFERTPVPTVDDHINYYSGIEELLNDYACLMDECQSPIEKMIGAALLFESDGYNELRYWMDGPESVTEQAEEFAKDPEYWGTIFGAQVRVGKYRADFLIASICRGEIRYMAIECDGHDYHEKTKEQASRDKKRDRKFLSLGIPVLRFTGSDIHRSLDDCLVEITNFINTRLEEIMAMAGHISAPPRKKI